MGRKTSFKAKVVTSKSVIYPFQCNLASSLEFIFFQTHERPKRPPIVNKIRKSMLEQNWSKKDYDAMEKKYYTKERILDTLSSKFEPVVINALCEYLKIENKTSLDDVLANWSFEQKEISKRTGQKNEEYKKKFIEEYDKAWSQENIDKLMDDISNTHNDIYMAWSDDAMQEQLTDEHERELFFKLRRIYDQYPQHIEDFCNCYIDEES